MKATLIGVTLFSLTAAGVAFHPAVAAHVGDRFRPLAVAAPVAMPVRPKIEVVFALDTTGSMSGLIEAAKDKIFSIATTMASAQPAPEIRMGLVAFRDRGDAYVTRVVDLSHDLDSVYAELVDFRAAGGGDAPESVNAALYEAVHSVSWSADADSYRAVFLVGDSPGHRDYPDEAQYPEILASATAKGIVVNTIRCGGNPATQAQWREIASLTQGEYFSVGQAGDAIAIATPFDAEIAALSSALDATRLYYGSADAKAEGAAKADATEKLHARASAATRARRAAFNESESGRRNLLGQNELVDDVVSGRVDLEGIATDALPEAMQGLAPEARRDLVTTTADRREALRRKIRALGEAREAYLSERVDAVPDAAASLDYRLYDTVKAQTAEKGLDYAAEAPKL